MNDETLKTMKLANIAKICHNQENAKIYAKNAKKLPWKRRNFEISRKFP